MPDGKQCKRDHDIKFCWIKEPEKCPDPRIKQLLLNKIEAMGTSSRTAHVARMNEMYLDDDDDRSETAHMTRIGSLHSNTEHEDPLGKDQERHYEEWEETPPIKALMSKTTPSRAAPVETRSRTEKGMTTPDNAEPVGLWTETPGMAIPPGDETIDPAEEETWSTSDPVEGDPTVEDI